MASIAIDGEVAEDEWKGAVEYEPVSYTHQTLPTKA